MNGKSFTMLELLIVVIVIAVLAALGIPAYQNWLELSKTNLCCANLKALKFALDIYMTEHNAAPSSLSALDRKYIDRAYAMILKQKDSWKIKLAYFAVGLQESGLAYAGFIVDDLARGNKAITVCPSAGGSNSYALNSALAGLSNSGYKNLAKSRMLIMDYSEGITFNDDGDDDPVNLVPSFRHKKIGATGSFLVGLGINNSGTVLAKSSGGSWSEI